MQHKQHTKKINQYKNSGSFEGWAKRIVINYVLQQYRNQSVFEIVSEKVENPIVFGGHVYVEIPIIPITVDVSGGASFGSYNASYTMSVLGLASEPIVVPDVAYGSYNFLGTIKYNF